MANDTSLMCSLLTGVVLKGLTLQIFVFDICACKTMFYVCVWIVDWLERGFIGDVLKCAFAYD